MDPLSASGQDVWMTDCRQLGDGTQDRAWKPDHLHLQPLSHSLFRTGDPPGTEDWKG